jgi:hypothetical protein
MATQFDGKISAAGQRRENLLIDFCYQILGKCFKNYSKKLVILMPFIFRN